jgi:hypothetical protein
VASSKTSSGRAAKRIASAVSKALTEDYGKSPGKVDTMSRLSYVLGLQKALEILMEEIKAEGKSPDGKRDLTQN